MKSKSLIIPLNSHGIVVKVRKSFFKNSDSSIAFEFRNKKDEITLFVDGLLFFRIKKISFCHSYIIKKQVGSKLQFIIIIFHF